MDASNDAYITEADGYFQQTEMPYYDPPLPIPNPPNTFEYEDQKRCPTGISFIKSLPGILNIIILVSKKYVCYDRTINLYMNIIDCICLCTYKCWYNW